MLGRTDLRWIFPVVHCWEPVNIWGIPKQIGKNPSPTSCYKMCEYQSHSWVYSNRSNVGGLSLIPKENCTSG